MSGKNFIMIFLLSGKILSQDVSGLLSEIPKAPDVSQSSHNRISTLVAQIPMMSSIKPAHTNGEILQFLDEIKAQQASDFASRKTKNNALFQIMSTQYQDPLYIKAMKILNNKSLLLEYHQDLSSIQKFFTDYIVHILQTFHVSVPDQNIPSLTAQIQASSSVSKTSATSSVTNFSDLLASVTTQPITQPAVQAGSLLSMLQAHQQKYGVTNA